jgi:hypothetical protein
MQMRKLFLHVGLAKCGSTSLQAALSSATGILFPRAGNHGGEHLAFALHIRGIDAWTHQYFDETWVETETTRLMDEIHSGSGTVVLSSERLAACSPEEIARIAAILAGFDVHVIIVGRDVTSYLNSTWRHAVFFHDYGESYETFVNLRKDLSFAEVDEAFGAVFPVHRFRMDAPDYIEKISALLGTNLDISRLNVGVPMAFAELLQKIHALLGSEEFKKRFNAETKEAMLAVWNGEATTQIAAMDTILF